jgi:hypothetical protein
MCSLGGSPGRPWRGCVSNHRNLECGGYWIARSSRAMTVNLKHLFVDTSLTKPLLDVEPNGTISGLVIRIGIEVSQFVGDCTVSNAFDSDFLADANRRPQRVELAAVHAEVSGFRILTRRPVLRRRDGCDAQSQNRYSGSQHG